MRFHIEQVLAGEPDDVQAALVDPGFLERLASLPKLGRPELLEQWRDGAIVHQKVRYRFAGDLNAAARAVLDPARLTWIEDSEVDTDSYRTTFRILPDHYADKLACHGTFQIRDAGDSSRRMAEGELKVRMPLVAGKVERAILSGIEEHAVLEAAALDRWLQELR